MRLDLHCHSKYSNDAALSPAHIARIAKQKNLVVAITDHNTAGAWKEYSLACKELKVPFVLGQEQKVFFDGRLAGELLFYFLNEEIKSHDALVAIDEAREQQAFVSVAHPFEAIRTFHSGKFFGLEEIAKKLDAVEVYNSRCLWAHPNSLASDFAAKKLLGITAGSDAHFAEEIGNAFVELEADSLEFARKLLKKRACTVQGKISPFFVHVKTQLVKRGFLEKETD